MADIGLPLERHSIVRVRPRAWRQMLSESPDLGDEPLLSGWVDRGWPVIARRPTCADIALGNVPLGLRMPLSHGRRRLMLNLPVEDLLRVDPPPLLCDAAAFAPDSWRACISAAVALDGEVRCAGSLAWQLLTGLVYINDNSDLDLLWATPCAAAADRLCRQIERVADRAPMRIDGEFLTPAGLAVAWRDWLSSANELVVKANDWMSLMARRDVFP